MVQLASSLPANKKRPNTLTQIWLIFRTSNVKLRKNFSFPSISWVRSFLLCAVAFLCFCFDFLNEMRTTIHFSFINSRSQQYAPWHSVPGLAPQAGPEQAKKEKQNNVLLDAHWRWQSVIPARARIYRPRVSWVSSLPCSQTETIVPGISRLPSLPVRLRYLPYRVRVL